MTRSDLHPYQYADATKNVPDLAFTPGSRGCEGIEAARGRFRDPEWNVDEHRRLLAHAIQQAGLPSAVLETVKLPVLVRSAGFTVDGEDGQTPSFAPQMPIDSNRAVYRAFSIDEMAQLPDFSFALWDWARANEDCALAPLPYPYAEPQICHQFSSHMGATNSNHFPPQSDTWYDTYHDLAKARAEECTAARKNIWTSAPQAGAAARDARFSHFFRACEVEALTYEAVAQHFLQDSWSAGHMWHRWGTTNLDWFPDLMAEGYAGGAGPWNLLDPRFRKLMVAEIVAVSAGTIHGSDPVLWEEAGGTLRDQLCHPHAEVKSDTPSGIINVVGDLHVHDLIGGPPQHADITNNPLPYGAGTLSGQTSQLVACATGSVAEVYALLSDPTFGAPVLGAATAMPPSFDSAQCRAPLVTNLAMSHGIDVDDTQPVLGELKSVLVDDIPGSVEGMARNDYGRLRRAAQVLAKVDPEGTLIAQLHLTQTYSYDDEYCDAMSGFCAMITYTAEPALFTMLTVEPNRCYDAAAPNNAGCKFQLPPAAPLAPFVDPKITGPLQTIDPSTPAGAQVVAFHASRASQLCNQMSGLDFQFLKTNVAIANDADLAATCDACAEWTTPFLRIGTDANNYDATAEPLCAFVAANPATVHYVYQPAQGTSDATALARRYCGCTGLVAATDAGLQRLVTKPSGVNLDMQIVKIGSIVPVGSLPRDVAPASGRRLLVGNGAGQIVGVRDDQEVDLDGAPQNGITRLTFSGVGDVQALTVVNLNGKEIVLAVTVGTGELVAWDLTNHTQCDRFTVSQVAGQGAYDVVTTADGSMAFVSLRKTSPLSGAVAIISLPAIGQCNGSAAGTIQWLTTPGAAAGLGPMALAPDGSKLAVGGRLASTCLDQIRAADAQTQVDTQVGCDRVFILDVATKTWLQFGANLSMPTRPGRYPYGVAWFGDSVRLVFSSFQGIDNNGNGDSGWPANFSASPRIPVGATLRLVSSPIPRR